MIAGLQAKRVALWATALLLAGLAISWGIGSLMVRGERQDVPPPPLPARDIRLRANDGVVLAGTYWPGSRPDAPGILLLHGLRSSRAAMAPTAAWLSAQGYGVLTIDFRGHGESATRDHSFGLEESRDAHAAFAWLKRCQHSAKVAVIGSSLGGAASLLGPAGPVPADALVLQAVYPDIRRAIRNRISARLTSIPAYALEPLLSFQSKPRFGVWPSELAPVEALRRFSGPVLVIGGVEDRYTPPDETRAMFDAARGPKSLLLVPGRGHAAMGNLDDRFSRERVRIFLARTIGQP